MYHTSFKAEASWGSSPLLQSLASQALSILPLVPAHEFLKLVLESCSCLLLCPVWDLPSACHSISGNTATRGIGFNTGFIYIYICFIGLLIFSFKQFQLGLVFWVVFFFQVHSCLSLLPFLSPLWEEKEVNMEHHSFSGWPSRCC